MRLIDLLVYGDLQYLFTLRGDLLQYLRVLIHTGFGKYGRLTPPLIQVDFTNESNYPANNSMCPVA